MLEYFHSKVNSSENVYILCLILLLAFVSVAIYIINEDCSHLGASKRKLTGRNESFETRGYARSGLSWSSSPTYMALTIALYLFTITLVGHSI